MPIVYSLHHSDELLPQFNILTPLSEIFDRDLLGHKKNAISRFNGCLIFYDWGGITFSITSGCILGILDSEGNHQIQNNMHH